MDAANDCARARTLMFACFVSDFESDDPRMASQAFEEFRRISRLSCINERMVYSAEYESSHHYTHAGRAG